MKTVIIAIAVLASLAVCPSRAAPPLAQYDDHDTQGLTRISGPTYVNGNYGFSVRVPAGETGWMNAPPSPNHGLRVFLGPRRSIEVDASFDSALLGSTQAAAGEAAGHAPGARISTSADTLGHRAAERIVQSWPEARRRRIIVARWDDTGGPGDAIIYTQTLETTAEAYARDERVFDAMAASFRFVARKP